MARMLLMFRCQWPALLLPRTTSPPSVLFQMSVPARTVAPGNGTLQTCVVRWLQAADPSYWACLLQHALKTAHASPWQFQPQVDVYDDSGTGTGSAAAMAPADVSETPAEASAPAGTAGAKGLISKRMRRVLANRASAARSKDRKRAIEELETQASASECFANSSRLSVVLQLKPSIAGLCSHAAKACAGLL